MLLLFVGAACILGSYAAAAMKRCALKVKLEQNLTVGIVPKMHSQGAARFAVRIQLQPWQRGAVVQILHAAVPS